MWDGKKRTAQQVFYDAMDIISKKITDVSALEVFEKAINNTKPMIKTNFFIIILLLSDISHLKG